MLIWEQNLYFAKVKLTEESIKAACQFYADNAAAQSRDAESGELIVNDLAKFRIAMEDRIDRHKSGLVEPSVAFLQHAYYIQTGKSVALLP